MERPHADSGGTRLCAVLSNTHQALKLDTMLSAEAIPHRLIPTPRSISHACGMAVAFAPAYREKVADLARRAGLTLEGIFPIPAPGGGAG